MQLEAVHVLLTYTCLFECDHCFVWGSPRQRGTLSLKELEEILRQSGGLGGVEWIYFEGGEPFLFYPVLRRAVARASAAGFSVGLVSNAYWATEVDDAVEWLRPFADSVHDLSISSDEYHTDRGHDLRADNACEAARRLGIPASVISVAQPDGREGPRSEGTLPSECVAVMFRGRAAEKLVDRTRWSPWWRFGECPHEELRSPNRVHVDPLGNVHLCQGILLGNMFRRPLRDLCDEFDPEAHPIVGPLLAGGPSELRRRYGLDLGPEAADACHLCYRARVALRPRFPEILGPDQVYGATDHS